jgi:hypothetical protein
MFDGPMGDSRRTKPTLHHGERMKFAELCDEFSALAQFYPIR